MYSRLPDKLYCKIGEVAEVAGVRTSVLRFWESEFAFIKPVKSSSGQRLYSKKDVELILEVKHLLYDDKFTIEGVKKRISTRSKDTKANDAIDSIASTDCTKLLNIVRDELKSIQSIL